MALVTIIRQLATTVARIDRRYKYLDPTNKFIQKFVPPGYRQKAFQLKRYADVAITGGIIYEAIDTIVRGSARKPNPFRKARKYMEFPRSKRFLGPGYSSSRTSRSRRNKYCRPSRSSYRKYY